MVHAVPRRYPHCNGRLNTFIFRYKAEVRWKEQFGMPVELMPNAPRETFGYRRTYRLPDETTDPDVVSLTGGRRSITKEWSIL